MIAVKFHYDLAFLIHFVRYFHFMLGFTFICGEPVNNKLFMVSKIAEPIGSVIIKPRKEERRKQQESQRWVVIRVQIARINTV